MHGDLGARLVQAGLVEKADLARALQAGGATGSALAVELVRGGLSQDALARFFLTEGYFPLLRARDLENRPAEALAAIDAALAHALFVLPLDATETSLRVAMVDPSDEHGLAEVAFITGRKVEVSIARVGDLERAIEATYGAPPAPFALVRRPARPRSTGQLGRAIRRHRPSSRYEMPNRSSKPCVIAGHGCLLGPINMASEHDLRHRADDVSSARSVGLTKKHGRSHSDGCAKVKRPANGSSSRLSSSPPRTG